VHADPPDEGLRVVAVDEKQLEGVYHDQNELDLWKQRLAGELGNFAPQLTICRVVRYFFHQRYFWYCGPMAENM